MKEHLERYLQQSREGLVASLDGLSDDDVRRPMTASGTNLLGVVKHVATTFGHLLVRVVDETARHAVDLAVAGPQTEPRDEGVGRQIVVTPRLVVRSSTRGARSD